MVITFNQDMDMATLIDANLYLWDQNLNAKVAVTRGYDSGTFTATLNPVVNLANSRSYTIYVTTGCKDTGGTPLHAEHQAAFTTIA
jgi:hypothetical protein